MQRTIDVLKKQKEQEKQNAKGPTNSTDAPAEDASSRPKAGEKRKHGRGRPATLPPGTHLITIPLVEMESIVGAGADANSALYQKVTKRSKKEWVLNPRNKSAVCILHEYLQHSLKRAPDYEWAEVSSSTTPYSCAVVINGITYGKGINSSKKLAKNDAAKATLEILIPELKGKLKFGGDKAAEDEDEKQNAENKLAVSTKLSHFFQLILSMLKVISRSRSSLMKYASRTHGFQSCATKSASQHRIRYSATV